MSKPLFYASITTIDAITNSVAEIIQLESAKDAFGDGEYPGAEYYIKYGSANTLATAEQLQDLLAVPTQSTLKFLKRNKEEVDKKIAEYIQVKVVEEQYIPAESTEAVIAFAIKTEGSFYTGEH